MKDPKSYRTVHSTKTEVSKAKGNQKRRKYEPAFADEDFLLRDELRPVRLQLELLKPELVFQDKNIHATIVFFGSARIPDKKQARIELVDAEEALAADPKNPAKQQQLTVAKNVLTNSKYLDEASKLAGIVSKAYEDDPEKDFYVVTGGGPSYMEAANHGAAKAGKDSIALNIMIPHEQFPNDYVTPELTFQFHYFAIRKMHFLIRAKALIAFPGGFGTCDELFDALTLIQNQKMQQVPILLFGKHYWQSVINFDALLDNGMISESDMALFEYVETAEEAWEKIVKFYE